VLHGDPTRNWKSVFHPRIESKMLSPQDLQTWVVQRFKYAGGTLDIALHDNPLVRSGMTFAQKVMYGATMWSYIGGLWNVVFLFAPIIYLFTNIAPVATYSWDFMRHIVPFLITNELAFLIGTWGISNYRGKSSYLAFFPLNLRAIWTVVKGEQIKFPTTPKERQTGNFAQLVQPQMLVILLTIAGLIVYGSALAHGRVTNVEGFFVNAFWAVNNILAMTGIVRAAYWQPEDEVEA
jgi:cellulose synthase (UDP-forming)